MPRYSFERKDILSIEEIRGMIKSTSRSWLPSLMAFLYLYGPRINEALKMKRQDIWEEKRYLVAKIETSKHRTKGPIKRAERVLRVNKKAQCIGDLTKYLARITNPERLIWPYSRWRVWKEIGKVNPQCSPHIFRHTRLQKLAKRGATELELMDWAGWSDPRPAHDYLMSAGGRISRRLADEID